MSSKLEIAKVDRFQADWDASTMFTGFKIRATLTRTNDMITALDQKARLQKRLRREIGEENVDWKLITNPINGDDELYLHSSGTLLMWKLQNNEDFDKLFDRVEQHTDNADEISGNADET
jgi:hypothetical protein